MEPGSPFPALSIRQPWAELILLGRKTIEVRTWIVEHRGPIWLHAGRARDPQLDEAFGLHDLFRGGYVGSAVLTAIMPLDRARWELLRAEHLDRGGFAEGRFGWLLTDVKRLVRPVAGPGRLNLFHPEPEVDEQLRTAELVAGGSA